MSSHKLWWLDLLALNSRSFHCSVINVNRKHLSEAELKTYFCLRSPFFGVKKQTNKQKPKTPMTSLKEMSGISETGRGLGLKKNFFN